MPLSRKGKTLLAQFIEEYGKKKGKQVFYAKENKDPKFRKTVKGH